MEVQEDGQREVEQLSRFFYTGSTTCVARLPFTIQAETVRTLQDLVLRVSEGAGRVMMPLQLCLQAEQSGLADESMLFLALSCCLKIDCKTTRTQVYSHLKRILVDNKATAERFLEFKFMHRMVFKRKPHGMGNGMRKLLQSWYLKQDTMDLAIETQRVHSRHRWSHSDLIKLARVTAKNDPEKEAVLDVCVRGFEEVQKKQKGNPATTSVLDYIGKVRRLKKDKPAKGKQEAWDPTEAINLIRNQSFTIDDLPSEHLNNPAIWEAGLSWLPLDRVLFHLKSLARRKFLDPDSTPSAGVLQEVLTKLTNPATVDQALRASNLTPSQMLVHHTKVSQVWKPLPGQPKEDLGTVDPRIPIALDNLLHKSLNLSQVRVEGKVLVAIDCRSTLAKNYCWGQDGLTCARAAAASLLSLKAGGITLEVVTCVKRSPGIVEVGLGIGDESRLREAEAAFTSVPDPKAVDPCEVVAWARSRAMVVDMILVISDSCTVVKEGLKEELVKYREEIGNVKFVYSVLGCKAMDPGSKGVAVEGEGVPKMLDIMGWATNYVPILQAFLAAHH